MREYSTMAVIWYVHVIEVWSCGNPLTTDMTTSLTYIVVNSRGVASLSRQRQESQCVCVCVCVCVFVFSVA